LGQAVDMNDMDIAVVIVTYKSAQLTINSLASIHAERASEGLRIRVIVVDNASGDTDAIALAVKENDWSSWVTLVTAPRNGGFAYGNNLGIARAYEQRPPRYVYLLNPDTEVRTGAVGSLAYFMESHPDVGIAGSGIDNPDGSEWPIAFKFPTALSEIIGGLNTGLITRLLHSWEVPQRMAKIAQPIDWVSGASLMIRPTLFATIGGLDENYFLYFEETDLCFRAKKAGFSTWYVPESRVMHLEGQSTQFNARAAGPRRLPAYWFESRRRYFAVNRGVGHAIAIDIVAIMAYSFGWMKRFALRRMHTQVPYFLRDLIRHSVLWRKNRNFPPVRNYRPKGS
jgi:N-acetylglucosaminyl-diphospho-decaprenol L-rhamnosyltransferase